MHQQKIEEVEVGEQKAFLETYCTVEDRWVGIGVDGFGLAGLRVMGGEVKIWKHQPEPRDKPSAFEQFLCSLFWFACIPVAAWRNWWRDRDLWTIAGSVQIKLANYYFDASGQLLGNEGKTCVQESQCELYQYRVEFGAVGFPPPPGGVVDGVRTIARILIGGRDYTHDVWQSDSGREPPPAP